LGTCVPHTVARVTDWPCNRSDGDRRALSPRGYQPAANPASWTRFANTLYIDERQTGFSYGLLPAGTDDPSALASCVTTEFEDASDFVRVLLAFQAAHPALEKNPVVLVGESYVGTRATAMLDMLLRYPNTATKGADDLADVIRAHDRRAFPDVTGDVAEATAATQFGHVVLVEPLVAGHAQWTLQKQMETDDPDFHALFALPQETRNRSLAPLWDVSVEAAPRPGVERPGWIALAAPDAGGHPAANLEIRFPTYAESSHVVSVYEPAALADDVEAWFAATRESLE
jgi:hypothetical protein